MAHRALRNGKRRACGLAGAGERVGVVVESAERGVVQPGVLDEFELPGQVGRQAEEIKPGSGSPLSGLNKHSVQDAVVWRSAVIKILWLLRLNGDPLGEICRPPPAKPAGHQA